MAERLLEVKGLKVRFATEDGVVRAVDGVDFELDRGRVLGIVGESGSGKSVTALTLLGLTRGQNASFEGDVLYKGQNLISAMVLGCIVIGFIVLIVSPHSSFLFFLVVVMALAFGCIVPACGTPATPCRSWPRCARR